MSPAFRPFTAMSVIALLSLASLATADDTATATGSARPVQAGQAVQGSLAPELVKPSLERTAAAKSELRQRPLTKDQAEIFDIQESGRTQVLELQQQVEALPDGPARRALELKVVQVKRDTEVLMLRTLSAQALRRGDLSASRAADEAIEMILHPKAPQTTLVQRSAPGEAASR
jgi:hypothetical protein